MDSRQVSVAEANRGPQAGSILLAVIVGALLPVIALTQISLLVPVLMLGGIMAAYLGARSGWIPVGVLAVASGVSTGFLCRAH